MVIDGKSSGGYLINARVPQGSCLGSSLLMLYINSHLDVINVMVIFSKYGCFCNFFYLGFLSRAFTIHRTAGEGGRLLF